MSYHPERIFSVPIAGLLAGQFVVLGASWPALPFDPDLSMRYAIICILMAFLSAFRGSARMLVLGLGFTFSSTLVPILAKGYDSYMLITLLSTMLGYLAYRYPPPPKLLLWVLGALFAYLSAYYLRHGQLDDVFYYGNDNAKTGVSRNYVGILLLQQYLVYYAICVRCGSQPRHWPLFIMPIMAVMSAGVSSTITATLALGGYLYHRLSLQPRHGLLLLFAVATAASALASWVVTSTLFERLTSGEFVVSRLLLWSDFAWKLDANSVLIGFPRDIGFIDHEITLNEVHNLHNSYLNLYVRVGLFSMLYFALVGYTAVALLRRKPMLGWLLVCALFRGATDGYFFSSFLVDFILFFLFTLTPIGERALRLANGRKVIQDPLSAPRKLLSQG